MSFAYKNYDGTQGSQTTIDFDLQDSEGEVALYSDLSNTIAIQHFNGSGYTAYTSGGSAVVLDASNSQAFIQGPGSFKVILPASTPLSVVPTLEARLAKYSES